jgi:hypothetical protein
MCPAGWNSTLRSDGNLLVSAEQVVVFIDHRLTAASGCAGVADFAVLCRNLPRLAL